MSPVCAIWLALGWTKCYMNDINVSCYATIWFIVEMYNPKHDYDDDDDGEDCNCDSGICVCVCCFGVDEHFWWYIFIYIYDTVIGGDHQEAIAYVFFVVVVAICCRPICNHTGGIYIWHAVWCVFIKSDWSSLLSTGWLLTEEEPQIGLLHHFHNI